MNAAPSDQPWNAILPGARLVCMNGYGVAPTPPGLKGFARALAAHRAQLAGAAPVKTFSVPSPKISELHGLEKAIALHKQKPR